MKPSSRVAALAALAVAAAGCTATYTGQPGGGFGPPQVTLDTPGGGYPIYAPPGPIGGVAPNLAAPPGMGGGALPPPTGAPQSGIYDGTAMLLENDLGDCPYRFAMTNMHVNNGYVRFASYHGRIGPDGGVRMTDGSMNWIVGHFAGDHFAGTYENRFCAYSISLDRAGP